MHHCHHDAVSALACHRTPLSSNAAAHNKRMNPHQNLPPISYTAALGRRARQPDGKKQKPKKRSSLTWLWVLLLLMGGAGFLYWHYELAKFRLFGF